jgi:hypothetical protein
MLDVGLDSPPPHTPAHHARCLLVHTRYSKSAANLQQLPARLSAACAAAYHAGRVLVHVLLHLHQLRVAAAAGVEPGLVAELQAAAVLQAQGE